MVDVYSPLKIEEERFTALGKTFRAWVFRKPGCDRAFILPQSRIGMIISIDLLNELREGKANGQLLYKLAAHCCSAGIAERREIRDQPPRPEFLMIDVTTKCNLNCSYCLRHFPDEGENISKEKLDDILSYIVRYCTEYQINSISIQPWGGEPLLSIDSIFHIQDVLEQNGIHVNMSIQTNGILLTESIVNTLFQRKIRVGVSIDGCREVQNAQRKGWTQSNSYDLVCKGIGRLRKRYGENFGSISVVTHQSIQYLERSLDVLCKDIGIISTKINPVHPNGQGFDSNLLLTDNDIPLYVDILLNKLVELNESGYHFFESNIRDKLINLLCGKCREICHSEGCTGGYASVTFSRDGDIYPCELIGHEDVRIGSIYDGKALPQLINESIAEGLYFLSKHSTDCDTCPWWTYCRGGCTASCMSNGWDWGTVDQTECLVNRTLYPKLIELILERPQLISALTNDELKIME